MKKIVINALAYKQNSSGIGVMIRELFEPYTQNTHRFCQVLLPNDGPPFNGGNETETIRIPYKHEQGMKRIFFQTFQMGRQYCKDTVLLTTDSKVPFFLPKSCTLIPLITDLAVFRMPEAYQASRVLWWRFQYQYLKRHAAHYFAISEYTKRDIQDILHVPEERITVLYDACSQAMRPVMDETELQSLRKRYRLSEQFILFVGNSNPRKNLRRLMEAFDCVKDRTDLPHQLIIAGEQGWKFSRDHALAGLKHAEDIRFIGFVPDEEMPALYSAAEVFAFPTLYEGFGIPVLEAQACGTPVLTSNCTALPEVGGDAAIYADPCDVDDIAEKMEQLIINPVLRVELQKKGFENVKRFSWEVSARKLDEWIEGNVTE